jgi:hypothetical protein
MKAIFKILLLTAIFLVFHLTVFSQGSNPPPPPGNGANIAYLIIFFIFPVLCAPLKFPVWFSFL